jgi:hypothetical protein
VTIHAGVHDLPNVLWLERGRDSDYFHWKIGVSHPTGILHCLPLQGKADGNIAAQNGAAKIIMVIARCWAREGK